ncbi:unnamed protein product, partial [Ectocarpus sp. 12 AP-2014]
FLAPKSSLADDHISLPELPHFFNSNPSLRTPKYDPLSDFSRRRSPEKQVRVVSRHVQNANIHSRYQRIDHGAFVFSIGVCEVSKNDRVTLPACQENSFTC